MSAKASPSTLRNRLRTADLACLWDHATVSGCGDKQPLGAPEMTCLLSCPIKTGCTEIRCACAKTGNPSRHCSLSLRPGRGPAGSPTADPLEAVRAATKLGILLS